MRLFAFFAFLVLLGVAAAVVTLPEAPGTSYSAFRTFGGPAPGRAGWVYHDDGKERFERAMGGGLQIIIRRPDLGLTYIIDPVQGTGLKAPIDDRRYDLGFTRLLALPAEAQGREAFRGETVTNFTAVDRYSQTHHYSLTDDGIPLRFVITAGIETTLVELTELKRGRQAAHLFEVPDGIEIEVAK